MIDRILDEAWADREVQRVLFRHYSELCTTSAGYALLVKQGININGGLPMADPILFKADDGTVQEVLESQTLTLEEIDQRIADSEAHVQHLKDLRVQVDVLLNGADSTTPDEGVETTTDGSAASEGAALSDAGAELAGGGTPAVSAAEPEAPAPEQPVVAPAPEEPANTAALNNGQVSPADSSNPTPTVPEQPIVGA